MAVYRFHRLTGKENRYEGDISSEYESEYDDDRLCCYVHDVHDEHGLLVYASDYLILTYYCFWVECREQVQRVLVPFCI